MIIYDKQDHYWDFGDRVYSSRRRAMLRKDDKEFGAWLAGGVRQVTPAPAGGEDELRAMTRTFIPQIAILGRLQDAGKFAAAAAALKSNDYLYQRWLVAPGIADDDPDALALLATIEVDPAVILALP